MDSVFLFPLDYKPLADLQMAWKKLSSGQFNIELYAEFHYLAPWNVL